MGRQHHLSQRKEPERALAHIKQEMQRRKNILIETPSRRLKEVEEALKSIGLEANHIHAIEQDPYSDVSLLYRWDGKHYVPYTPDNGVGYGKITIQWAWVKEPEEEMK